MIYLNDDKLVHVLVGEFFEFGRDHLARSTPGRVEVDENQEISSGFQLGVEVGLRMRMPRVSQDRS